MTEQTSDFDRKYGEIHARIQADTDLVRRMFALARKEGLKDKKKVAPEKLYCPMGKVGDLYVGLDLNQKHAGRFNAIVAFMRLFYELSGGKSDILRAYAVLDDGSGKVRSGLGVVSEDLTYGGAYNLMDIAPSWLLDPLVGRISAPDSEWQLRATTFEIWPRSEGDVFFGQKEFTRLVIADLDHILCSEECWDKYSEYRRQYLNDERFRIHEV